MHRPKYYLPALLSIITVAGHNLIPDVTKNYSLGKSYVKYFRNAKEKLTAFARTTWPETHGQWVMRPCKTHQASRMQKIICCSSQNNTRFTGSFENEALENEDRSTKHPSLENEAPKSRKRSTQNSETEHLRLEKEAPKTRKGSTQNSKRSTQNSKMKHPNL